MEANIAVFRGKGIRKIIHKNEWWFSVSDVVEVLTDSADPRQYIKKMRQRDPDLNSYWGTICTPLKILAPDAKMRETHCANTADTRWKTESWKFWEPVAGRNGGNAIISNKGDNKHDNNEELGNNGKYR